MRTACVWPPKRYTAGIHSLLLSAGKCWAQYPHGDFSCMESKPVASLTTGRFFSGSTACSFPFYWNAGNPSDRWVGMIFALSKQRTFYFGLLEAIRCCQCRKGKREKYRCWHLEKGCGNGEWNGYKELSAWISVRCRHEIKGYLCPGKKGLMGPNTNINKKKNKVWRKCKKWNTYITKK